MRLLPAIATVTVLLWAAPSQAAVTVTFADPARFTDATRYDVDALGAIKSHFQHLGARYLGRGETLRVTILDFDLAGFDLSSRGPSRLRVLNGATSPKIRFRYRLESGRKLLASGEESLSDHSYLSRPGAGLSSDPLRYEKSMLDDWFRQKFQRTGSRPAD
jgi:hypothetical protein